jgi:hypothetical protein
MAFTELEIAQNMKVLEDSLWTRRRPALHLRDRIREGQRFTDQSIELFFVRPAYNRPSEHIEESIAKVRFVRTQRVCVFSGNEPTSNGMATNPVPKRQR